MGLDRESIAISTALRIAKEKYTDETYNHAVRVMGYVAENETIPYEYREECLALAIMHDLLEDTDYKTFGLPENFEKALKLLTKPKDMDYIAYIKQIKNTGYTNYKWCAWWVKLADMKDHLMQKETLTEKLRDKYLAALPELL